MIQNKPNRNQLVKQMFLQIQGLPTTQNLSKGISSLRIKLKSEAKSDRVRVDSEGNYSHKQAVFRHIIYRGLMKRVSSSLHALFTELIDGDNWMACLHEDARFEFGDNSFFGDVVCEVRIDDSDATVDINEFRLKSNISGRDHILVHKLNSLFQLIFLGLGGGSERSKAIESMTARQVGVVEELSCIYYTLLHNKQYRVETVDRSPSNHKMPDIFFAYYLIFRKIVALLNTEDAEKCLVFINVAKPKWTVSHWMGEFFHINPAFATIPVIRQFFTSITNKTVVVLEKLQSQIRLTANRLAAESCNHSEIAHAENYATLLADADEVFYETYHSILGLPPSHGRRRQPTIFAPSSEARIIEALQAVHGSDADFRSDNQMSMIVASCNEASKHKFFGTACGSGKSSAIVIPPIVQFLSNRAIGTTIVVTPYGFLASTTWASLHDSLQDKFGDNITVDSFSGSDVLPSASSSFPANLARHPPNILILTLDAAANLIQHHSWALEKWSNEGILRAVKFDEIQTVFTEFGFRKAYQAIAQFAALGCEVTLLSGSCPKKLAFPLMRCLNLLSNNQNESEVTTVFDSDLIGEGFDFISVKCNNRGAANAALLKLVGASLSTGKGHAHVICAEKRDAEWLKSKLPQLLQLSKLPDLVVELVTADTPRAEVDRIASAWREGLVHLLITTTCGLVGNENKLARFIFFHHCLYAITNLIQGIGRLRLIQRGPDSVVTHIESDDFIEEEAAASRASQLSKDCDTLIDQLKTVGALNQSDVQIFQKWFHISGYLSFIKSEGRCQMQLLKEMTGHQGAESCGRCTHCLFHTSFCSVDQAKDNFIQSSHLALEEESEQAVREIADNIADNRASNSATVASRVRFNSSSDLTRRIEESEQAAVDASQTASQTQAKRRRIDSVNDASIDAQRASAEQSRNNRICIQRLADLQSFCANCANSNCNGEADNCQKSCRVCGDQHYSGVYPPGHKFQNQPRPAGIKVCPWASHNPNGRDLMKEVGDRGFCAFCLCPTNEFTLSHKKPGVEGSQCSVNQRFVRVICAQRKRENNRNRNATQVSHRDFVLRITSSVKVWENFLANAPWPSQSATRR
jgi:MinD-like ATPase involved in chromosome partitioning or flagellar assembly